MIKGLYFIKFKIPSNLKPLFYIQRKKKMLPIELRHTINFKMYLDFRGVKMWKKVLVSIEHIIPLLCAIKEEGGEMGEKGKW